MASVVSGEAAESDLSEEEQWSASPVKKTAVVTGEASESDEEPSLSASSPSHTRTNQNVHNTIPRSFDSLLHKKLVECNSSFHENINKSLKNTIENALSQLSLVDRQLLKSQLRLQQANSSLKTLESGSVLLAEKLSISAYGSYIPKITIPLPDED